MTKMLKKPVSILLAVLMVVSMFAAVPISANAAEWTFKLASDFSGSWEEIDLASSTDYTIDLAAGTYEFEVEAYVDGTFDKYRGNSLSGPHTDNLSETMYDNGGHVSFTATGGTYTYNYDAGSGVFKIDMIPVAQIGTTNYGTLEGAFAAAGDGDTITVLADTTLAGVTVPAGKAITLDCADKTVTVTPWSFANEGTLTVTGTTGGLTGDKGLVDNYGTLNITGGVYSTTLTNPAFYNNLDGNVINVSGGTINAAGTAIVNDNGTTNISDGTINGAVILDESDVNTETDDDAVNFTGGTINGNVIVQDADSTFNMSGTAAINLSEAANAVEITAGTANLLGSTINCTGDANGVFIVGDDSVLNVNGVTINNEKNFCISSNGTAGNEGFYITIDSGNFTSTNDAAVFMPQAGTLEINDGTFTGTEAIYIKSGTVEINDGTFISTADHRDYEHTGNGTKDTGDVIYVESCNYPGGAPVVTINGGTFTAQGADANVLGAYTYADQAVTVALGDDVVIDTAYGSEDATFTFGDGASITNLACDDDCKIVVDETTGAKTVVPKDYVAQVGETKYEDLQAAINDAVDGDTVTVLTNIALTGSKWFKVVGKDITIDLGGNTISSEDSVFALSGSANLTVENGTMVSTVANDYAIYVQEGSTFTLADDAVLQATNARGNGIIVKAGTTANIYGTIESGYYSIAGFGTAVVNVYDGADITSTDASAISGNGSGGNEGYTFNVYGGTLTSTNDVAIYHPNQGTLNITGGTITGATAIYIKSGTTDVSTSATSITGATIVGNGAQTALVHSGNGCNPTGDAIVIENCGYPGGTPDIEISGGTITSENAQDVGSYGYQSYLPIKNFVSGGSFAHAVPAEQCAEGFVPAPFDPETGMYTVVPEQKLVNKHSISLNGNIDLNFYMNPAVVHVGDTINITWDKGSASWTIKQSDLDLAYGYKVKVELPAAEMTYKLHVTDAALDSDLYYDDYSVRDYCDAILASNPSEELATLVKTMLDYGAKAQVNFKTNTGDLANAGIDYTMDGNVTDEMITDVIDAANGSHIDDLNAYLNGVATDLDAKYYTSSLIYLSGDTLRLYFTPTTWPSEMPNASDYAGNKSGYYYYVQKYGIEAANLDVMQTFTVGGHEFQYSALDYVRAVLSSGNSTEAQQNLAKATYWYNVAANAYFV